MDAFNSFIGTITGFLWDYIIIIYLVLAGFWFTFSTGFI